jgi:hypothetical protein
VALSLNLAKKLRFDEVRPKLNNEAERRSPFSGIKAAYLQF